MRIAIRLLRYGALLAVAAAVAAAATTAFAGSAPRATRPALAASGRTVATTSKTIARELVRHFGIFRRNKRKGHASADAVGGLASYVAETNAGKSVGVAPADAHSVNVTPSTSVTVVPGSAGACLVTLTPTDYMPKGTPKDHAVGRGEEGICAPTAPIEKQGLQMMMFSSDGTNETVIGMVPDGNRAVDVTTDGGTVQAVPVVQNVYAVSGSGFRAVALRDSAGTLTTVRLR